MRSRNGVRGGAILKLYCKSCNEYVFLKRPTSATVRCPFCFSKISGRKQREVWKELNDERQGRLDPIEKDQLPRRKQQGNRDIFDD